MFPRPDGQAARGDTVLRIEGLVKRYASVTAVAGLDLQIRRGEFFTLLGPSGSGKSTTLLLIAGFETPTEGEIYLNERPVSRVPAYRRRIGVVFQHYALFPHLSVGENVAFALRNLRWPENQVRVRVQEMLHLVQLDGFEERAPAQLSGGQQQRVALARALAFSPSILLLDEPLGALDRKLREHMLTEFRRIHQASGVTMVYVTHDQEEALAMSDRIGVMNHGRLLSVGAPRDLYEDPRDSFVADFLGEVNFLTGVVRDTDRIMLDGSEAVIAARCVASRGTQVRVLMRPEKVLIGSAPPEWNAIPGRVTEVVYLGEATRYRVCTKGGQSVWIKRLNRHVDLAHEIGREITLCWHPLDAQVVQDNPPDRGKI